MILKCKRGHHYFMHKKITRAFNNFFTKPIPVKSRVKDKKKRFRRKELKSNNYLTVCADNKSETQDWE